MSIRQRTHPSTVVIRLGAMINFALLVLEYVPPFATRFNRALQSSGLLVPAAHLMILSTLVLPMALAAEVLHGRFQRRVAGLPPPPSASTAIGTDALVVVAWLLAFCLVMLRSASVVYWG